MFNILPSITITDISIWEQIVSLCVYMVCNTALIITLLLVVCSIAKHIITLLLKQHDTKRRDENLAAQLKNIDLKQENQNKKGDYKTMKKILALIICLIMIISSCLLTGCFDDIDDSTSNATSESTSENADANKVSLLGIQASVNEDKSLQQSIKKSPAASLLSTYTTTPEIQTMSNTHSGDELLENDGGYLSIFKSQTIINFTIKLNNPYDYYILDFRLGADDEEVEYYTSEKTWKSIADRDIRWMGSDNATCTYILRLSSPDATPSKIRIKWMYYTDKHDGRNRFAVNMNNKDKYTIYKFDESIKDESVKVNIIKNPLDGKDDNGKKSPIEFNMTLKDGVAIDKVYFWNYSEEKYEIIEKF